MSRKTGKKKVKYSDEPMKTGKRVKDFLPPPEELAFKDDSVKVTITLSKSSVEFFKHEARKHHTPYQRMIRNLLDAYTESHQHES